MWWPYPAVVLCGVFGFRVVGVGGSCCVGCGERLDGTPWCGAFPRRAGAVRGVAVSGVAVSGVAGAECGRRLWWCRCSRSAGMSGGCGRLLGVGVELFAGGARLVCVWAGTGREVDGVAVLAGVGRPDVGSCGWMGWCGVLLVWRRRVPLVSRCVVRGRAGDPRSRRTCSWVVRGRGSGGGLLGGGCGSRAWFGRWVVGWRMWFAGVGLFDWLGVDLDPWRPVGAVDRGSAVCRDRAGSVVGCAGDRDGRCDVGVD
ncbi:hypothetical protein G443_000789 [Actinoalloteichus cyanogriseus DSM 43889]|uniref:Uncharacterized protein n=1 Tax=Actinoalloteichus caeruleus DSM 43889 TaxID=1120930 RepID=A0ABT1JDF6_ACTCY|nr:hypothetical protein [Actinoalloteichus caeruleus DSM 43889]